MNNKMSDFWLGKRVFLTGHTGFKGCWLALWLEILGADVFGYSLEPQVPSLYEEASLAGHFHEQYGDICDGHLLKKTMAVFKPDIVFHLAAQPLVRLSYKSPTLTYQTNVMGTVNLLEAVRTVDSIKSVVVITTDKCYKDMEWEWGYREADALGGLDPYSSSKACAELVCDAWKSSYFTGTSTLVATARAGNVVGGGDWAEDRLIPDAVRAFKSKKTFVIRSPRATRPWQHVLEPLNGYLVLAERLHGGDEKCACAWNFGPLIHDTRDVENVAKLLVSLWGKEVSYTVTEEHAFRETHSLRLDSSKAMHRLKWKPLLNSEEAIKWTVEWYQAVQAGASPFLLTREQIMKYAQLLYGGSSR